MLGPALERIDNEVLRPFVERTFAIALRAGIIPPPPPEISGQFVSVLAQAQQATRAASIERILSLAGSIVGVVPEAMDNIDVDYSLDKLSSLLNNDPKMIRSPDALAKIRADRAKQAAAAQQADIAQKLSAGAKNLSGADMGNGQNALQAMIGKQ